MRAGMLTDDLRITLEGVGQALAEARHDWWVIASAAAALHGVTDPPVGDVDVLVDDADLADLSRRRSLRRVDTPPHPLFASRVLMQWTEAPMTVELMAGFRIQSGGRWRDVRPTTRRIFVIGSSEVFAPSREELAELLLAIGRPKDIRRARSLIAGV